MKTRPSAYQIAIEETLKKNPHVPAADPRIIEAWMRVEHPTLDHLSPREFDREVKKAAYCAFVATEEMNENLAKCEGL
ncbi:MAG: hypothetical protein JXB46_02895 [Candidatus Eisenbacteria bacterium]|nr:hypothetical protein [Candidatus Eisenbacteria bacterium]